jgi:hypothetical protein
MMGRLKAMDANEMTRAILSNSSLERRERRGRHSEARPG